MCQQTLQQLLIDIHTHKPTTLTADHIGIQNLYEDFERANGRGLYSVGIHPWHVTNYEQNIVLLQSLATHPHVLAIGECGLDKLSTTNWELQVNLFRQQIQLANSCGKPLIIHCVRAFDEVTKVLAEEKVAVPVIFHGYNNKPAIAHQLIAKGYYLSLGAALLHDGSNAAEVLATMPAERLFLETDDKDVDIKDVYQKAAQIRKSTTDAIILQVETNFTTVFKR